MSLDLNKMLIIPAVDIKNGKCVQLVQGKPGTEQVIIENPEKVALKWQEQGASIIHVIDLDAALGDQNNIDLIKKIQEEVSVPIQLGGGIRSQEYAENLLDLGIERLILGTMAIENPHLIENLSKEYGKERIMVALDSKDSVVVIKGWSEKTSYAAADLGKRLESKGAGSILFTNVDVEGLLQGFHIDPLVHLLKAVNIPVVYSGGITSLKDLQLLKQTRVNGVVIGSALYKKKIDFKKALHYQD